MSLVIPIVIAVVLAFALAYLVVKFLPLKFRWLVSLLLLISCFFLVYKIYIGVMAPINFDKRKAKVYSKVIQKLKLIRDAEIAFYEVNGDYTKDKDLLIKFIDTAQRAIIETRDTVVKVNKGSKWQPIMVEEERKVTDTIGYEPIIKAFRERDYKNMFKVPNLEDKEFTLEIGKVEKVAGLEVPVFEAKIDKKSILKGEDISLVKQEIEAIQSDQVKGAFVSVGSLSEVTNGGNWPPSYDKAKVEKKN